MPEVVRYGLVGTGMMGVEHLNNLAVTPGAVVTAIADPVEQSLGWARKALGDRAEQATAFADSAALASERRGRRRDRRQPQQHPPQCAGAAVRRGPADPLREAARRPRWRTPAGSWSAPPSRSAPFWTAMEYRYMPPAAEFIEEVHGGRIGAAARCCRSASTASRSCRRSATGTGSAANTGGTMVEKCCHFFDLMRLITALGGGAGLLLRAPWT